MPQLSGALLGHSETLPMAPHHSGCGAPQDPPPPPTATSRTTAVGKGRGGRAGQTTSSPSLPRGHAHIHPACPTSAIGEGEVTAGREMGRRGGRCAAPTASAPSSCPAPLLLRFLSTVAFSLPRAGLASASDDLPPSGASLRGAMSRIGPLLSSSPHPACEQPRLITTPSAIARPQRRHIGPVHCPPLLHTAATRCSSGGGQAVGPPEPRPLAPPLPLPSPPASLPSSSSLPVPCRTTRTRPPPTPPLSTPPRPPRTLCLCPRPVCLRTPTPPRTLCSAACPLTTR